MREGAPRFLVARQARAGGSLYEEARLYAPGGSNDRGKLRRVAACRRVSPKTSDGGEILQDAPQLLRAFGDEAGAEIFRVIPFDRVQYLLELRQVLGPQRQIGDIVISAPEGVGIGHIHREEGDLARAEFFCQIDECRQLPEVPALQGDSNPGRRSMTGGGQNAS